MSKYSEEPIGTPRSREWGWREWACATTAKCRLMRMPGTSRRTKRASRSWTTGGAAITSDNHVLMLTLNALALTREAVASVLAQDVPVELLVLDDGSLDGTMPYLRALSQVQAHGYRHQGVSALWNIGLEYLFNNGAEHVLVVNNDVKLRPDTYRLLRDDGGPFVTCVGTSSGANWPGGEPSGEKRPHPDFSCWLIRRECWEKVGEFDERMRIYCGDGDYHLRMHKAGIEAYCLDLPFWHYASGTLKQADEEGQKRILERATADRQAFFDKWGFDMGSPNYYKQFEKEEVNA